MHDTLSDDKEWEEEWKVILHTKGEYVLSKMQAIIIKQAMVEGKRHVMFETYAVPINYIVEFYRVKRFKKNTYALPATATEEEYKPISPERYEKIRKEIYAKLGKAS